MTFWRFCRVQEFLNILWKVNRVCENMWDRDGKIKCRIVSHSYAKLAEDEKQSI
jgi:hypothetical protein